MSRAYCRSGSMTRSVASLGLPCALCAGDIVIAEFIHALPRIDREPIASCDCICKIFLIPAAVAAVLRLAVNDVANDAVDLVWLLHQRRVAAARAEAGCDRWTDFARFPDSRVNAVIFINEWLMAFSLARSVPLSHIHSDQCAARLDRLRTKRMAYSFRLTALERWGDFLRVADGSGRRTGASRKKTQQMSAASFPAARRTAESSNGTVSLSAFRQANQSSLYL